MIVETLSLVDTDISQVECKNAVFSRYCHCHITRLTRDIHKPPYSFTQLHFTKTKEVGVQLEDKARIVKYIVSLSTTYVETTVVENTVADLMLRFKVCKIKIETIEVRIKGPAMWKDFLGGETLNNNNDN